MVVGHLQTHCSCLRRAADGSDEADPVPPGHRQRCSAQGFPSESSHFPSVQTKFISNLLKYINVHCCIASCYGHTGKREVTLKVGTGVSTENLAIQNRNCPCPQLCKSQGPASPHDLRGITPECQGRKELILPPRPLRICLRLTPQSRD